MHTSLIHFLQQLVAGAGGTEIVDWRSGRIQSTISVPPAPATSCWREWIKLVQLNNYRHSVTLLTFIADKFACIVAACIIPSISWICFHDLYTVIDPIIVWLFIIPIEVRDLSVIWPDPGPIFINNQGLGGEKKKQHSLVIITILKN